MGKITIVGADRVALKLELKGKKARQNVRKMLSAGSEIVIRETHIGLAKYGMIDTGQLFSSIQQGRERITNDSASVDITPMGERTRGKKKLRTDRNATIGFVQEHGRSYGKTKRPAKPFFANAAASAMPEVVALWGRMASDE